MIAQISCHACDEMTEADEFFSDITWITFIFNCGVLHHEENPRLSFDIKDLTFTGVGCSQHTE